MLQLAEALGTEVIAEGVESPLDLGALKAAGVKYAQGYLWGRPNRGINAFRSILPESVIAELRGRNVAI